MVTLGQHPIHPQCQVPHLYPGLATVVSEAAVLFVLKFVPSVGSRAEQLGLAHLTSPLISLQ